MGDRSARDRTMAGDGQQPARRRPMARAGLCHQSLTTIRGLPEPVRGRVLAVLPEDLVRRVDGAHKNEWLPLQDDTVILEALLREVGAARFREVWREAMLNNFVGPVLGPVLKVAVGMFGLSPTGLLRFAPQAFQSVFKEAGRLEVAFGAERSAVIALVDAPDEAARAPGLREALAATFDAGVLFGGAQAGATIIEADEALVPGEDAARGAARGAGPADARVVFRLSWT